MPYTKTLFEKIKRFVFISVEQHVLSAEESTVAASAKAAGYATGFFGKWHLGSLSNATADCYTPRKNMPTYTQQLTNS